MARCRIPCACHAKPHLNFQKWSEHVCFFYILTWKCASHHNGMHFWDMSTCKSVPNLVCFVRFDLGTCFAPQRRALFRHLNFQNGPRMVCFVHFDLEICFAPQRRALFLHRNFHKWSEHCVLYILAWKCASRQNGVQLFSLI